MLKRGEYLISRLPHYLKYPVFIKKKMLYVKNKNRESMIDHTEGKKCSVETSYEEDQTLNLLVKDFK